MNTQALFGEPLQFDQIASCRVNRLRVQVGGIQTAVARLALGGQRTQVWLTLTNGRTLTAVARDDPHHAHALEQFLDELERDRTSRWFAAFERGETVAVGKVTLTRDQISVGRKRLAWRDVGGWSMREGGFMIDGPNHRMVINLWIATTPWIGAIANILEAMAPGKNYDQWPPASLPRVGFTATSALTHIPGTLTMRARGYMLLGLIAIPLIGLAVYSVMMDQERSRLHAYYTRNAREQANELAPKLADPAFAAVEPCKPTEYGRYTTYLTGVQGSGTKSKLTRGATPISELDNYPSELLVWDVVGDTVRAIFVEEHHGSDPSKLCSATVPGTKLEPLLEQLERKATKEELEAAASAPTVTPSTPSATPSEPVEPGEPAGSAKAPSNEAPKKASTAKPGLTSAAIAKTVKRQSSRIRFCYERALVADPNVRGRIDVKLEISTTGKVTSATSSGTSTLPESVRACVLRTFEAMTFPPSKRSSTVAYPVVFAPQ